MIAVLASVLPSLLLAQLMAQPVAFPGQTAASNGTLRTEGRCVYSPELEERAQGATLVLCGEATLTAGTVAFAQRGFAETARFEGRWDGDEFMIERVVTRGLGGDREADGTCHVLLRDEQVIRITCTAISGPHGYIANFVVPLL
jgi:hypothetical protein